MIPSRNGVNNMVLADSKNGIKTQIHIQLLLYKKEEES